MSFPLTRYLKWDLRPASEGVTGHTVRITGQPDLLVGPTIQSVPVTIAGPGTVVGSVAPFNEFGEAPPAEAVLVVAPPDSVVNVRFDTTP